MILKIDLENAQVSVESATESRQLPFNSPEAFALISKAWLRCGWDTKYVYGFSWLGRPIIQLPEDMIRIQEIIAQIRPDLIIETGVAHGGSLIFYASLLKSLDIPGQVIGIDIEIRSHNRSAIESHLLFPYIKLIEGSSIAPETVEQVKKHIAPAHKVLVMLDANHTKDHVLQELQLYGPLVSPGSYIIAADGIMADLVGAPRANDDWDWNNPQTAVQTFLSTTSQFILEEPPFPFNEGQIQERVTYWPNAYLRRLP